MTLGSVTWSKQCVSGGKGGLSLRSLVRTVMEGMEDVVPLPAPYKAFERTGALLYRGALSVLAGPPGSGKTISSLNFVNQINVPTLYVSNDSTRYTIVNRVFSLLSGVDMSTGSKMVREDPEKAAQHLSAWQHVRFDFSSAPNVEEIVNHGEAFRELYGEYPHLTVVDILMNVDHEGVAEQNYWRLMPALKEIASEQNTAVLAVHHTSESAKCDPCPPKSSIMGKANQLPELIVTQVMQNDKILYAVVKNRNGKSDESGRTFFELPVDAPRFTISEAPESDTPIIFRDGTSVPDHEKIRQDDDEF